MPNPHPALTRLPFTRLLFSSSLLIAPLAAVAAEGPASLPPRIDSGDNAWMLTSAALVLMMTGPGLALFYGGLVRNKNVLGTMMHSFFLMSLISILWFLFGYGMTFG